jgi:hypothetical protein
LNEALTSFLDPASVDFSTGVNSIDRHAYVLAASAALAGPDPCGEPADAHESFQDIEAEKRPSTATAPPWTAARPTSI